MRKDREREREIEGERVEQCMHSIKTNTIKKSSGLLELMCVCVNAFVCTLLWVYSGTCVEKEI